MYENVAYFPVAPGSVTAMRSGGDESSAKTIEVEAGKTYDVATVVW